MARIPGYGKATVPFVITLPEKRDGYLLLAEYSSGEETRTVISRRYIKVGADGDHYRFFNIMP